MKPRWLLLILTCSLLLQCDRPHQDAEAGDPSTPVEADSTGRSAEPGPVELSHLERVELMAESRAGLSFLLGSAARYFEALERQGEVPRFPQSVGLSPPEIPCGAQTVASETWDDPAWEALDFGSTDPQRYSYQFESEGSGSDATFTAWAFGDLDCDGVNSTFFVRAWLDDDGPQVERGEERPTE